MVSVMVSVMFMVKGFTSFTRLGSSGSHSGGASIRKRTHRRASGRLLWPARHAHDPLGLRGGLWLGLCHLTGEVHALLVDIFPRMRHIVRARRGGRVY